MNQTFQPFALGDVKLLPGLFQERFALNRRYLMSLKSELLLQNHYAQAGLMNIPEKPKEMHWGWESPTCQVRGHFLGHWLSGAARVWAATGDAEIKAKADAIVAELARCQKENGGEWAGSIPPEYLDWVARGKQVWAPHYTLHKTLMGLYEMATLAGNQQALAVLLAWARWFSRWTAQFSREQMDNILDVETGGMLEVWANLYGLTGEREHLELMRRYDRPRLFDRLLNGEDALTNMHANTTIPEAQGAARAWEVTGDARWREVAEAYWHMAVTFRGAYCTGGQTCGEIWTPPNELAARLGDKNQEHCVVYNMMRLADYLLRWSGEVIYADYWERNLYNGILAQQHPGTGQIAYFLPLEPGAQKVWGTPTETFWCCHGTLVQAHAIHSAGIYYRDAEGLAICQYTPSELTWERKGGPVVVRMSWDNQTSEAHRPGSLALDLALSAHQASEWTLKVRLPWWLKGEAEVTVNGERQMVESKPSSFLALKRAWKDDVVRLVLPKGITAARLPDRPDMLAFLDGPVVLAGLCDEERVLYGNLNQPEMMFLPDNEREWGNWRHGWRTRTQERPLRFIPLNEVVDQRYTVYFPVKPDW